MHHNLKNLFFKVSISLTLILSASSAFAIDLLGVYQQAEVSDPVYQAARAQYLAATQLYPQARALLLPNIGLTANVAYNRLHLLEQSETTGSQTGLFTFSSKEYTLNLSQPIVNFAAIAGLNVANYNVKSAAAQFASAAQNLMLRVASAYFAVLQAQDDLRFTQAEKRATARQLDQAKQRYQVGLDAITSVYDAQASYDDIVSQEIAAKNQVVNNLEALRQLTGKYYQHLAPLKQHFPLIKPNPQNVEAWVLAADRQNYDITAARYTMEAAKANIEVQFNGHLPTVDVVGSFDRTIYGNQNIPGNQNQTTGIVGLQLDLPIYQGGLIISQTKQAQYQYQQQLANYVNTYRQTVVSTHQTYNNVIDGISKIKADKQAIISQQSSYDSTEAALKAGTRTIVDLLIAQQNLYQAQRNLASDQYAYINNTLLLKQLAGMLSMNDLRIINNMLVTNSNNQQKIITKSSAKKRPVNKSKNKNNAQKKLIKPNKDTTPQSKAAKKIIHQTSTQKTQNSTANKTSESYYAIQLMASSKRNDLIEFAKRKNLTDATHIEKITQGKHSWYVLLYGKYQSIAEAAQKEQQLITQLNRPHLWVRMVG